MSIRSRSRWVSLRSVVVALLLALSGTSLPAAVGASAYSVQQKPATTKTIVGPNRPCKNDSTRLCHTVTIDTVSSHTVFKQTNSPLRWGTQAYACGSYSLRHSVEWWDLDVPTGLPLTHTYYDVTDGYDGCGGAWTININSVGCSTYAPGASCDGDSHGGNYSDPSHSYWNNDWDNNAESLWLGPTRVQSWTVYLRLWNDGYGNTDSWAGES